jgi:hypothetical protein
MAGDRGPEIEGAVVAKRMAVLRPHLIDGVPLARVAADAGIPIRTARRWIARYRADGPPNSRAYAGLPSRVIFTLLSHGRSDAS